MDVVREGFDCVLRIGTLSDSGLVARKLGNLAMENCASPAYLHEYEVLPRYRCAPMPVWLVHAHARQVPARVRAVMSWIASSMAPYLDVAGAPDTAR